MFPAGSARSRRRASIGSSSSFTPDSELASANGLNTLFRSLGSSLASAIGGSILAGSSVVLGGVSLPSLSAYRELFVLCAAAAVIAALCVSFIPRAAARGASTDD